MAQNMIAMYQQMLAMQGKQAPETGGTLSSLLSQQQASGSAGQQASGQPSFLQMQMQAAMQQSDSFAAKARAQQEQAEQQIDPAGTPGDSRSLPCPPALQRETALYEKLCDFMDSMPFAPKHKERLFAAMAERMDTFMATLETLQMAMQSAQGDKCGLITSLTKQMEEGMFEDRSDIDRNMWRRAKEIREEAIAANRQLKNKGGSVRERFLAQQKQASNDFEKDRDKGKGKGKKGKSRSRSRSQIRQRNRSPSYKRSRGRDSRSRGRGRDDSRSRGRRY